MTHREWERDLEDAHEEAEAFDRARVREIRRLKKINADLLAACEDMRRFDNSLGEQIDCWCDTAELIPGNHRLYCAQMRAAIAKAKGE